jgi:hypothetical protein
VWLSAGVGDVSRKLVISFKGDWRRPVVVPVPDDFEVRTDDRWLYTARGVVAVDEVLAAYVKDEDGESEAEELRAA